MRVSREQASQNRDRVLDAAAALFRERGFGGVGVAELMNAAGLTHGGFYGQFESKDDLKAQACERAAAASLEKWQEAALRNPDDALRALVSSYVSTSHRDHPGSGCLLAALGGEAAREGPKVRRVASDAATSMLDTIADLVPGKSRAERRQRAAVTLASMVGAVVLARLLEDENVSKEVLRAVRTTMAPSASNAE